MNARFFKTMLGFLDRKTPGYMIFFVTPYCDCRCRMCFNRKTIDSASSRNILSIDEIEKIAQKFPHLHHVNFSGGEPFLRPDFGQIPALFYKYSDTRFFACPTNSSQPERIIKTVEKICESCPDAWIRITQSLDGIGEDHDAIRGRSGLFERVIELNGMLENLCKSYSNLSVGIAMVMSAFNQGKEKDILDYVYDNLSFADFGALYARGETLDAEATKFSDQSYIRFVELCRDRLKAKTPVKGITSRLFTAINMTATDLLMKSILNDCYVTPCKAGRNMVVMDDEGTISPCEVLQYFIDSGKTALDKASLGNIREYEYDIKKVLNTDRTRQTTKYIKNSKCYCSFECAMSVNVLYTPALWAKVLNNFFRQ